MPTMYRRAGNGNWAATTLWSDTEGGASNGSFPDATTNVIFGVTSAGTTTTIPVGNPAAANSIVVSTSGIVISSDGPAGTLTLYGSNFTATDFVGATISALYLVLAQGTNTASNLRAQNTLKNLALTGGTWNWPLAVTITDALNITSASGTLEFSTSVTCPSISASTGALYTLKGASCTGDLTFTGSSAPNLGGTSNCVHLSASGGAINFGDVVLSLTGNATISATTVTPGTGTLKFVAGSGSVQTFTTGAKTYPTVWNAQTSTATLTIAGSGCTFNVFRSDSGRTTTFTAGHTFNIAACNASGMIIRSTTTSAFTWNNTSGVQIDIPNANVQYSTATGTGGFRASGSYTDAGNNTGWFFGGGAATHRFFSLF